jgi:hypothetical protein
MTDQERKALEVFRRIEDRAASALAVVRSLTERCRSALDARRAAEVEIARVAQGMNQRGRAAAPRGLAARINLAMFRVAEDNEEKMLVEAREDLERTNAEYTRLDALVKDAEARLRPAAQLRDACAELLRKRGLHGPRYEARVPGLAGSALEVQS